MDLSKNISQILAENYFQAARTECDMFKITRMLEEIRELATNEDLNEIEDRIEVRLGECLDSDSEFLVMQQLQQQIRAQKREIYGATIAAEFDKSIEDGWNKWLEIFGFELTKAIEDNLNFLVSVKIPPSKAKELGQIKKLVPYVIKERWAETIPLFELLTGKDCIPSVTKGELYALTAQIYLYHLWSFDKALEEIEKLKSVLPNSAKAERTLGEYYIQKNSFDKAREHLQNALEADKKDFENYVVLGNLYKAENRFETAENWYNEGIQINPGKADLYNRILLLNEHESYYNRHNKNIDILTNKIIKLDKEFTFTALGNAGFVHQKNGNFDRAEEYYIKVTQLFPDRILGYINLAYSYLDKNDFENSENAFRKSLEIDLNAFDAYWGLVTLFKKKGDWLSAITYLNHCEKLRPEWNYYIYNDFGFAYESLKDFENAQKYYLLAIENDPEHTLGLNALLDIAEFDVPFETGLEILDQIKNSVADQFDDVYFYRAGKILYKNNQFNRALEYFKKAIAKSDPNPAKEEYLGLTYEKLNNLEQAEAQYQKAISIATQNKDVYYNRLAFFLTYQNRYKDAIEAIHKAIGIKKEPLYYENLGYAQEMLGDFENAKQNYLTAIDLAKNNRDSYENRLGIFYYNRQNYSDAIQHYSNALNISAKTVYYENIGLAYENNGDLAEAEKSYRKAIELNYGKNDAYWNRLGIFYFNQQNYNEAIKYYQKAVEIWPKAVYYENIGNAFNNLEDYENAKKYFLKAFEKEPNNYTHHENLGIIAQKQKHYSNAIDYFEQALAIAPENSKSFFFNYIGNCWYAISNWEKAADYYREAIKLDETQEVFFNNLLLALNNGNHFKDAIQLIEKKLANEPQNYTLTNQLGLLYIKTAEYNRAAECFEKNIDTDPANSLGYDNLGYVFELMNLYEDAVKIYIRALKLFPNENVFIENFGKTLLNIPQADKRKKYYNEAIKISKLDKSRIIQPDDLL